MRLIRAGLGCVVLAGLAGCSSDDKPSEQTENNFITGDDDGTAGASGAGAGGVGTQCLGETRQAEAIGLDMFVMLDISASMLDVLPQLNLLAAPRTKWDAVRQALQTFIQAPETSDIGIGIQYFPQVRQGVPFACTANDECGASGGPCSNSLCVQEDQLVDPAGEFPPLTFLRSADGDVTYCTGNADCAGGAVCRSIAGQCVFSAGVLPDAPAGGFINVAEDPTTALVEPLCSNQNDCQGLPATACEQIGICQNQLVLCSATIACPPGAGACGAFPHGCVNQTQCEPEAYATPAVPISSAADRSMALLQSLQEQIPNGLTPTGPALRGALEHARGWAEQNFGRQVVTVLATDGFPTECAPVDIPDIATIAQAASSADRPVRTFVIGVFGSADLGADGQQRLDALARAGGTDEAFIINTGGNVVDDFANALNEIRDRTVSCEFQLGATGALDFDRVNLRVTDASGGATDLVSVGDAAACGSNGQGWYYVRDSAGTPLQINVCPSACATFMGEGVRVDLQIGCETRIQ